MYLTHISQRWFAKISRLKIFIKQRETGVFWTAIIVQNWRKYKNLSFVVSLYRYLSSGLPQSISERRQLNISARQCVENTHTLWRLIIAKIKWPESCVVPEGNDAGGRDAVAQEIQLLDGGHALLPVESQAVGGEDGEHARKCVQCRSLALLKVPSSSTKEKTYSNLVRYCL